MNYLSARQFRIPSFFLIVGFGKVKLVDVMQLEVVDHQAFILVEIEDTNKMLRTTVLWAFLDYRKVVIEWEQTNVFNVSTFHRTDSIFNFLQF